MKNYNFVLVLGSIILSASAHASALNYVFTRGPLSPDMTQGYFCQITADGVIKKDLGKNGIHVNPRDVRDPLIFNTEIPNQAVLDSLVQRRSSSLCSPGDEC